MLPGRSPIPCMLDSSSYARLSQASQARLERFMQRPRCSPTRRGMHSFFPRASTLIHTHPHSSSCIVVARVGLRLRLQDISHCAQLACRGNPSPASAFWRRRRESESFRVQRVDKTTAIAVRSPDSEGFAESPSTVVGGGRGSVAFSCTANGIAGASATSALSDLRASARAAVFSTCQGARDLGGARQSHTPRPTRRAVRYASLEYQRYTVCLRPVVPTPSQTRPGGGTPVAC